MKSLKRQMNLSVKSRMNDMTKLLAPLAVVAGIIISVFLVIGEGTRVVFSQITGRKI